MASDRFSSCEIIQILKKTTKTAKSGEGGREE
jgi:hypothetical protein